MNRITNTLQIQWRLFPFHLVDLLKSIKQIWWGILVLAAGTVMMITVNPAGGFVVGDYWWKIVVTLSMAAWVIFYASYTLSNYPHEIPDANPVQSHKTIFSALLAIIASVIFFFSVPKIPFIILAALQIIPWVMKTEDYADQAMHDLPRLANLTLIATTVCIFLFTN